MVERGSSGKWIYDLDYANRTNYIIKSIGAANWAIAANNFQATKEQPFRFATTWRWQDETCPVHEATLSKFCQTASKLNLTRFLIVGDSLSSEFFFSLRSLLGYPPSPREASFNGRYKPLSIPCNVDKGDATSQKQESSFTITFWLYRRSPVNDWVYLQNEADSNDSNGTLLANAYRNFVQDNDKGTAIIGNMGGWMPSMNDHIVCFQAFLNWIDSFPDTSNIITFFRPTIPGHQDCMPFGNDTTELANCNWSHPILQEPHPSYDSYFSGLTQPGPARFSYDWNIFEKFNQYSKHVLENRTLQELSPSSSGEVEAKKKPRTIHWLNIFNSSVLRRDGHIGFNDCLHYYLPGPTDTWVHFFYSNLEDLANNN